MKIYVIHVVSWFKRERFEEYCGIELDTSEFEKYRKPMFEHGSDEEREYCCNIYLQGLTHYTYHVEEVES